MKHAVAKKGQNMNTKAAIALTSLFLGSALLMGTAKAEVASHSKNIVIEQPTDLPELAQRPGIAFHLYTETGDGSAYLYVEQHNGERLLVFDVTDPGHVKMVRAVTLSVPGPFDFADELGVSSVMVRFRNNQGVALLDMHKAKAPILKTIDGLQYIGRTEPLGDSAYLMVNDRVLNQQRTSRDYQVIDGSHPANPTLLYTAKLINETITRDETGTTFLLGADGLTIIRRPHAEEEYEAEQRPTN